MECGFDPHLPHHQARAWSQTRSGPFALRGISAHVQNKSKPTDYVTPEQSPLCSGFFFACGKKEEVICPLPCPSFSAKGHARLACSVVNALATARCRHHPFAGACDPNCPLTSDKGLKPHRAPGLCFALDLRPHPKQIEADYPSYAWKAPPLCKTKPGPFSSDLCYAY